MWPPSGGKILGPQSFQSRILLAKHPNRCEICGEKCEKCQKFGPNINTPSNELKFIHNPIPFTQWGLDLLGPFLVALAGVKFLIVVVDYFTKWIEAEPLATITSRKVEKFIW